MIKLFVANLQCKHIVFAGAADKDYKSFLRSEFTLSASSRHASKITIVESIPFPSACQSLCREFRVIKLPDILRQSKIVLPGSNATAPSGSANVPYASPARLSAASLPANEQSQTLDLRPSAPTTAQRGANKPRINWNKDGERIDEKLPLCNPGIVQELKSMRLCHRFYLTKCEYDPCKHIHSAKLSVQQRTALKRVARTLVCPGGRWCEDPFCVAAHNCLWGADCDNPRWCRYPHVTDWTIAETT